MKKKILTLGPVMPYESEIATIATTLAFLEQDYQIDYLDPLSIGFFQNASAASFAELNNEAYYRIWESEIKKKLEHYDAFFGFSFGGVILQQCFSLFAGLKKTILLFSTPTFADEALEEKLGWVVRLCQEQELLKALNYLYEQVFYPNPSPLKFEILDHSELALSRLIFGLQRVLATNSAQIVRKASVEHLHLIGEYSALVNQANVEIPQTGHLVIVPTAGMRVLQDNPSFCQTIILRWLKGEF